MADKKWITLADFIEADMRLRGLGVVDYAAFVGVSHATISKHLNRKKPIKNPWLGFLVKLSGATNTPIEALLALAYPDTVKTALSPRAMILAQRLSNLPEAIQDEILRLVLGDENLRDTDK